MPHIDPRSRLKALTIPSTAGATEKSTRDLLTGTALQRLKASDAAKLQAQGNVAALARTALPFGLTPGGPSFDVNKETLRVGTNVSRDAGALNQLRRAGLIPDVPEGGLTAVDMLRQKLTLGDFPGQAQQRVLTEATAKKGREVTRKRKVDALGLPLGIGVDETIKETAEFTGKAKGAISAADVRAIISIVKNQLKIDITEANIDREDSTHFYITLPDGTNRRIRKP